MWRMLAHRGRITWDSVVLLLFAAALAFPDQALSVIAAKTGRDCGRWWHFVIYEVVVAALAAGATALLMPICPRLEWWLPLVLTGALLFIRGLLWAILDFLGLNE